jgi:hypothetical protein
MIVLTEDQVDKALPRIAEGLSKYCWIQNNFEQCNVCRHRDFQTRFDDFYKVRRNASWRNHYYELMEAAKAKGITFSQALRTLRERTGRIEASFASKLVATLDPNKPVVDKFVLGNFSLRLPYHSTDNRESKTIQVYNQLCRKYEELMACPIARMIYAMFAQMYPWANITDLKKVDFVLWQIRDRKT